MMFWFWDSHDVDNELFKLSGSISMGSTLSEEDVGVPEVIPENDLIILKSLSSWATFVWTFLVVGNEFWDVWHKWSTIAAA